MRLARAAERLDEQPQPEMAQEEPQTEQPRHHLRICVFAEPELRAGLTEQGVEWVGGVELMDAILAVCNHQLITA